MTQPKIKNLMVKLNQTANRYMGKVFYSLFLITLLESAFTALLVTPVMMNFSADTITTATRILSYCLLFAAIFVWFTFQFGFAIMLLRMERNEYATLGYIFIGFRRLKTVFPVIFSLDLIVTAVAVLVRFLSQFAMKSLSVLEIAPEEQLILNIAIFAVLFFLINYLVIIHFAFVFHLHFDNPSLSVVQVFKQSFLLMRKNCLTFTGFALKAGGKNLCVAIVLAILATFIPTDKGSGLSILGFIIDFVYFINAYTAMVKMYFTIPVLYDEVIKPVVMIEILDPQTEETGEKEI